MGARANIAFGMNKMGKEVVIEEIAMGKEKAYVVKDEEKVIDLLITYRESFVDRAVDRFIDAWAGFGKR